MKKRSIFSVSLLLALVILASCEKKYGDPTLQFKTGTGWVSADTTLMVSDTIKVGLEASWNGHDLLDMLEIRLNDEKVSEYAINDETINFSVTLIKGIADQEVWEFRLTDVAENAALIRLTLNKDPNSIYGGILYYASILLGAQNSINRSGFLGFEPTTSYRIDQANLNQEKIDLLCYYDETDLTTLASPGSDLPAGIFAGSTNVTDWATRNKTWFIKTDLSEADFLAITIDAPIIDSWDDEKGTLKAGNLRVGDVYLFKLHNGRKGVFRISRVISLEDGEVEFAVKIQD